MFVFDLMKSAVKVLLTSTLAAALVLTSLHQMFWRYEPLSFDQPRASVHLVTNTFGSCSGVMIAPKRMLTATHCLGDNLQSEGKPLTVLEIIKDSMLVEVDLPCPCVPVGASIKTGDPVYIVGFPLGIKRVMTTGHFEGFLHTTVDGLQEYEGYLVFVASVEGGFSGGGVFQFLEGEWVLVTTVTAGSKTLLLSPSELAKEKPKTPIHE